MSSLGWLALAAAGGSVTARPPEIFEPYLRDRLPEIVEELEETQLGEVRLREFWFLSREIPGSGQAYHIHCILTRPTEPGPHPGIVLCHGGGGYAEAMRGAAIGWAERGYVAITQDAPGISNRSEAKSRGPYYETSVGRMAADPDATASALYDGLVAVLNSLAILRSQPDVDTERIGIFGGSWGGYTATMIAGLAGDKIRAAFSVYGCGFYDVGSTWMPQLDALDQKERQRWLDNLDAGRQAVNIRADYMILVADNDWFFWPPAATATLDAIPGDKNYLFSPNDYHQIRQPGGTSGPPPVDSTKNRTYMEVRFMDWKLRGVDNPFPSAQALDGAERLDRAVRVRFRVRSQRPVAAAHAYWSGGEMPWRFRWWQQVAARHLEDGVYEAILPVEQPAYPIDWVSVITDDDNASVSTRIRRIDPVDLGFGPEQVEDRLFREDFEGPWVGHRWRWAPITRRDEGGTFRITSEAAHTGGKGLMLHGPYSCCAWGFRAAPIRHRGRRGLRLWARSATEQPLTGLKVQFVVELDRAIRHYWKATEVEAATLTGEWQRFDVPWDGFEYVGKEPPVDLLCDGLGELRFTLDGADQAVYIDDIKVLMGR